jgi:glycosyltransferase involved in cell wall biosynthesis
MKIAYINYEYPPDTALGGIATYVQQAARIMVLRGHDVEVFAASPTREGIFESDGITLHLVRETKIYDFSIAIGHVFARRHASVGFDVLEGPDYNADAAKAIQLVPGMPLVVKTHGSTLLGARLNHMGYRTEVLNDFLRQLGSLAKSALKKRIPQPLHFCRKSLQGAVERDRIEEGHARQADLVASPSRDLCRYVIEKWSIPKARVRLVPNPYVPKPDLLAIPIETTTMVVGFFGRVEVRKGVLDLAEAIPTVLARCPGVRFKFVGSPQPVRGTDQTVSDRIVKHLGKWKESVEFTGKVDTNQIPSHLASVDVAVFPSIWENFPYVCLEAMAAGRGIVGSSAGGMSEMLDNGIAGVLVPPRSPKKLAAGLIHLIQHEQPRKELGRLARQRVLEEYNADHIGNLMESVYKEAISLRHAAGPRK